MCNAFPKQKTRLNFDTNYKMPSQEYEYNNYALSSLKLKAFNIQKVSPSLLMQKLHKHSKTKQKNLWLPIVVLQNTIHGSIDTLV